MVLGRYCLSRKILNYLKIKKRHIFERFWGFKVSASLKTAIFPYLRFQRFQIGMLESFLLKKKSEENIISVERYRG